VTINVRSVVICVRSTT